MGKPYLRDELNSRLRSKVQQGRPIIIGGAGSGLTAKLEDIGGVDLIGIYNACKVRHLGAHTAIANFATGDANQIVLDLAPEVCAMVKQSAVIAGFCAQNMITDWERWCAELTSMGVSGFVNFPTVGFFENLAKGEGSRFVETLDDAGVGFRREMEVLSTIRELGYFTVGIGFNEDQVEMVANAGADVIGCFEGGTTGGLAGFKLDHDADATIKLLKPLVDAAKKARPKGDFLPITHGSVMSTPEATIPILQAVEAVGFFGGSSIERIPVESAVIGVCEGFSGMPINVPEWLALETSN